VILLDTNALIWADQRHPRARRLTRGGRSLFVSPAALLELQLLQEAGRIRLGRSLRAIAADDRWTLDEPTAFAWFLRAADLTWTRDPFDRLLAAHVLLRGWRLATGDAALVDRLGADNTLEL
jgi:PIN domain nuclease of toxin-antitoxin system